MELAKYKKFGLYHWYGGIASGQIVGCNIATCAYCWTYRSNKYPEKFGKWYTPEEAASKLRKLGSFPRRITAGEPTIYFNHLIEVIPLLSDGPFLLETNLILLNEDRVRELAKFPHLYTRGSLKGVDSRSSFLTTGREGIYEKQLEVIGLLSQYGIPFHVALMGVYSPKWVDKVKRDLSGISGGSLFHKSSSRKDGPLELEKLSKYPFNEMSILLWLKELEDEGYVNPVVSDAKSNH